MQKKKDSMEFIAIFFGFYALIFIVVVMGAFALYIVRGVATMLRVMWRCCKWMAGALNNMVLTAAGKQRL